MELIQTMQAHGVKPKRLLECVNHYADKWAIRWDVVQTEDEWKWQEAWVKPKPTIEEIGSFIYQKSKEEEQSVMNAGFVWEGMRIKMDDENQANFKQQFDLQLAGIFPIDAKYFFGEQSEIVYSFDSREKLQEWILAMAMFKAQTKEAYIVKRNSINLEDYSL